MTLNFPSYRNSFHPGWLVLLVPPVIGFLIQATNEASLFDFALILRLILAASLTAPVLWLRRNNVSGRTQRLLKELRLQMPGCLLAMLLPGMLGWANGGEVTPWILPVFGLGCALLGAAAFGSEFEQRTLPGLLAQPLSRSVLFGEKMGILGTLLVGSTFNLALILHGTPGFAFSSDAGLVMGLIPLFAICSGPLFSLLSRSTLAGVIFVISAPLVVYAASLLTLILLFRFGGEKVGISSDSVSRMVTWGIPVYLLGTGVAGWRIFARLQLAGGGAGGRSSTGLHPLSRPMDRLLKRTLPAGSGIAQLVRKELRLHVVPWLVGLLMVALSLLALTLKHVTSDEALRSAIEDLPAQMVFGALLGTLVLLTAGAACVAEERELGTLEWQLSQSLSWRRQWWTKVAVAMVVGVGLGLLLPAALIWASFSDTQLQAVLADLPALAAAAYGVFFTVLLVGSIYASSVAQNTMKATATATFIAAGLAGLLAFLSLAMGAWLDGKMTRQVDQWPVNVNAPAWAPTVETLELLALGAVVGVGILVAVTFFVLASRNFRRLTVPAAAVARQLAAMAVGLTLLLGALGLIGSQLALLRAQANQSEAYDRQRAAAVAGVGHLLARGRLTEEVAEQIGVTTNATAEAVVAAVIAREGPEALNRIMERFTAKPKADRSVGPFRMDPLLAKRYGLFIPANPSPSHDTNSPLEARTNPAAFRMDPALRKRYGLEPAAPKP